MLTKTLKKRHRVIKINSETQGAQETQNVGWLWLLVQIGIYFRTLENFNDNAIWADDNVKGFPHYL